MSKDFIKNIEKHLQDEKSKVAIEALITSLDAKRDLVLPAVLKEIVDSVGDNPLEAKKVAKKVKETDKLIENNELDPSDTYIEILEAVLSIEEIEDLHKKGITFAEFTKLGEEISNKVFYYKKLDEKNNLTFKEVDSHKEMAVLSFYERKEIRKLSKKMVSILNKANVLLIKLRTAIEEDVDGNKKFIKETTKEIKELNKSGEAVKKELDKKAIEYSCLDEKAMTEWEIGLAIEKVKEMAEDRYAPPMGKN